MSVNRTHQIPSAIAAVFILLATGCSKGTAESAVTASAAAEFSASAAVMIPSDAETTDCVVEQDLPLTLNVTIQDLTVRFIKADSYDGPDDLKAGDEITAVYTGELSGNPTLYEVTRK